MAQATVSILTDAQPGLGARHGLTKVTAALERLGVAVRRDGASDWVLVATVAGAEGPAGDAARAGHASPPQAPEALTIRRGTRQGKPALIACGADDRGLMYALLDIAERVSWSTSAEAPFSEVREVTEQPYVPERALSIFTMHRLTFERRLFDEAYWERYLDMLAANRFNSFALLFGYENGGYMAPPYPYFFDVEGFPEVYVPGLTDEQQARYLSALNRLIDMTHARGMNFTLGIWDHIYRGGVQGTKAHAQQPTEGIPWGVTGDNLVPYTKAALTKLFRVVPGFDAIQFRMHGESGLKRSEMHQFWSDVYDIVNAERPGIRFDARAKNFPDSLIDLALEKGINMRLCTKYWAEQMGLPFHPTHIPPRNQKDRRHGYADLLRYPQRYKMHWRLWNGGTTRVLLWADPDYVRRFAESTHLYDGDGYEVNEMLCTKMEDQPHDEEPFELLNPKYRYYDYEFERYWHFFQVFGRVGYNPDTDPEVWRHEFRQRFGEAGAPLEQALHLASKVLPYAQAYCFPYNRFPMTRGWVAKQRREDLPRYAKSAPSDTEQFLSFEDAAKLIVNGGESAKRWPQQSSAWFAQVSRQVLDLVQRAENTVADKRGNEFVTTTTDLRLLASLALYHSRRALAGLAYALFDETKDLTALDAALEHEASAIDAWQQLVDAAGNVYTDNLKMGRCSAGLCGHWRDELVELRQGLEELKQQRAKLAAEGAKQGAAADLLRQALQRRGDGKPPVVEHTPVAETPAGKPLTLSAKVTDPAGVKWVRLRYRSVTQFEDYRTLEMKPVGNDEYRVTVPGEALDPQWDFMYFLEVMDSDGNGAIWPDLEREAPYVVVRLTRA